MDFAAQLAALDADFEATEATGGEHPAGRFVAQINVCRIEEYEGTLSVKTHMKTDKGMAFGSIRLNNHPSEDSMGFAKGQLQNLGFKGRLSEVPNYLPALIGQFAEIDVKHAAGQGKHEGTTFVNVFVRKLVAAPAGVQGGFAPAGQGFPAQGQGFGVQPVQQGFPVQQAAPAGNMADIPFDAAGNPVQAQPVQQAAPVASFDAPAQPQSVGQAVAQATPPVAPTGLPFA